jgi:hypothetical protein
MLNGFLDSNYLAAAARNPRMAPAVFGKGLEVVSVARTPNLVLPLGGARQPDALIQVGGRVLKVDWTTYWQLEQHLQREYYLKGGFIIFLHWGAPGLWPF